MAKLKIYHLFAVALVLIRSRCRKRKKKEKVADNVSGIDLYLLIEKLVVVLSQIKIICVCLNQKNPDF